MTQNGQWRSEVPKVDTKPQVWLAYTIHTCKALWLTASGVEYESFGDLDCTLFGESCNWWKSKFKINYVFVNSSWCIFDAKS